MEDFNASLVREKIIFVDDGMDEAAATLEGHGPTVIRSNRIFLKIGHRAATEKIVVRTQNMHTTLRLAGKIMFSYYRNGLFLDREHPFDWDAQWDAVLPSYEKEFNPGIWAAVYINGKPVFKTAKSPFIDVIEKCALLTIDNYDATMEVTETALKQIGRAVRINHSSNVATVFHDDGKAMRCGVIHRSRDRDATFSFNAEGGDAHNRIVQSFSLAGGFLEGINLQFVVQEFKDQLKRGEIAKSSKEAAQLRSGTARLIALDKGIASFEDIYHVRYRPERPQFFKTGA